VRTTEQTAETYVAKDYWEKRLTDKWGLQGVGHISFGLPYNKWLYRMRRQVFRRHLASLKVNLSGADVLDIGSGTGFWLDEWRFQGAKSLTAVDITEVAVQRLRLKFEDVRILRIDISDSEVQEQLGTKFDVISAFDVLFHITNDNKYHEALFNVAQLLRPNGFFIFSDNLVHSKPARYVHETDRTVHDVTECLTRAGFRIHARVPMFVLMNAPFDSPYLVLLQLWRIFMAPVHFLPALGALYGALLYSLDSLLTRILKESPSSEIVICQKK
jgi:2-polyprenyl-3-methyl-5-hydroxy-6-metoxy-1,4-benzoquinol methylase